MNFVEVGEGGEHPLPLGVLSEDVRDHDHGSDGGGEHCERGLLAVGEPLGEEVGEEMRAGVGVEAGHGQVLLSQQEEERQGGGGDGVPVLATLLMVEQAGLQVVDRHLPRSISSSWHRAVSLPGVRRLATRPLQVDRAVHWQAWRGGQILQSLMDDVLNSGQLLATS